MSSAPNRYSTQANWCRAAPPTAMSAPRSTRASRIPSSRTRPWYRRATPELLISRTNTSRLSSDRLYSVSQPAKNWPAAVPLPATATSAPNPTASAIVAAVHSAASPSPSGRRRRAPTKRSAPRRTARAATVAAQAQMGTLRTLMASGPPPSARQLAELAGPPEVVGREHPGRGTVVANDQRMPGRVQRGRGRGADGQPCEQPSHRLVQGGGDHLAERGGHVEEPQLVPAVSWDQRQLAEREQPGRVPLEVPQRESRGAAGPQARRSAGHRAARHRAVGRRAAGRRAAVEERPHRLPARDGRRGAGLGQNVAHTQAGQGRDGQHLTGLGPGGGEHRQPDQPQPDTAEVSERQHGHAAGNEQDPGELAGPGGRDGGARPVPRPGPGQCL